MKYFINVLKHYADFTGRARRKEFWMFMLFYWLFLIAWIILAVFCYTTLNRNFDPMESSLYGSIASWSFILLFVLPSMAVTVRRLHDLGKSGYMFFIGLIPIIGQIWLFILMLMEGQHAENKYGQDPKTAGTQLTDSQTAASTGIIFIVYSIVFILTVFINNIIYAINFNFFNYYPVINIIAAVLLLISGRYMIRKKIIINTDGQKTGLKFLMASVSVLILNEIFNFSGILLNKLFFNPQILIFEIIELICILFVFLLVLFALKDKYRNRIRGIAPAAIAASGLVIILRIYSNMQIIPPSLEGKWYDITSFMSIFSIFKPAAFIVFAGAILKKKDDITNTIAMDAVNGISAGTAVSIENIPADAISAEASTASASPGAEPPKTVKTKSSLSGKIFSLCLSIFFIIGGFSGELVLRGTNSSAALVVVGFGLLIWSIISLVKHKKEKKPE